MAAVIVRGGRLPAAAFGALLLMAGLAWAQQATTDQGQGQQGTEQTVPEPAAWYTLTGPERRFTVDIPAAPKSTTTRLGTPAGIAYTMNQYALEQAGASYVVQYLVYPSDINVTNPQQNFQVALNAAGKRMDGGKWGTVEFIKHQGLPAADAVGSREGAEIRSYSVLKGRQLLTLIYVGAPGTAKAADAEHFVASLRLAP